jgi:hypothetical protein
MFEGYGQFPFREDEAFGTAAGFPVPDPIMPFGPEQLGLTNPDSNLVDQEGER